MAAQWHLGSQSLKLMDPCHFSPLAFIYLFSKKSPAVSPWGDASGECLLFVVTDQRRPQLHDVWLGLIGCSAAEMLSVYLVC